MLAVPVLASCSQTVRGEFSAGLCTNGMDDDGDDRYDCGDPDCWVFCPSGSPVLGESEAEFEDARMPDASMSLPRSDGGLITSPDDDDAGKPSSNPKPDAEDDAGMPNECTCPGNQVCIDGECEPRVISGEYDISGRAAIVPLYSATERCYDFANPGCTTRRPVVCECTAPDPYVVVLLDGRVLTKAITPEARRESTPVWVDAPSERVTLSEQSKLDFVVYDYDGLGSDTEIFRCSPDKSPLRDGMDSLGCNPIGSMTIPPPRMYNWSITVSFKKVQSGAE